VNTATTIWIPIVVAIITSSGGWGLLQLVLTRRQRKEEAEKKKRDDERELEREEKREKELREQLDEERRSTLSEAQITAQRAVLDAQDERYGKLQKDYDNLFERMSKIHDASWLVVDALESILGRLRPIENGTTSTQTTYSLTIDLDELGAARRSINDARRHLR
jgi:hypothetical protein